MAVTVREPLTYSETAPHSFYRDLLLAKTANDETAQARLDRHEVEMRVEVAAVEGRAPITETPDGMEIEYRANPSSTLGSGGEFTVPLWLVDRFATAGRAGRPFGDLLQPMMLPSGVSSIHTPRMTTGTVAGLQTDNSAAPSQDFVTTDAASNVVTIAGEAVISQQLFDLSPIGMDAAVYLDLNRAYNRTLESGLLYGSPNGGGSQSTGQLLGISNVSGINTVVGTGGTSVQTIWPLLGQVAAAIGNTRLLPPEVYLFAPRRWFSIASSVDSSNRPIASPGNSGPHPTELDAMGGAAPFGPIHGLPVYLDGAIPAGTSADDAFAVRPSDMFLWESAPRTITAPNPQAGVLGLTLSLHRYVAFIPQRYPSGIGRLTAMPQPSNF